MPLLICPVCEVQMRPKNQGVPVESMATFGSYQLFMADLYACPVCDKEVLTGFGPQPIAEHFEPGYEQKLTDAQDSRLDRNFQFWRNAQEKDQYKKGGA